MRNECESQVHTLLMNGGIHANQIKDGVENLIKVQKNLHLIKSLFDTQHFLLNVFNRTHAPLVLTC